MLSKYIPVSLGAVAIGGSAFYVTNFIESELIIKSFTENQTKDEDWLRDRNPNAFKLANSTESGSVWKRNPEGKVFKDESYFVFGDWGWLNKVRVGDKGGKEITGREKLKSYVNGVGLRVDKVKDKDEWVADSWQKKRDIKLTRVLMSSDQGYRFGGGYQVFDKESCFLRTSKDSAQSSPNLYLLIGFAKGFKKDDGKRPKDFQLTEGYKSFCDWYSSGSYGSDKTEINISFYLGDGKTINGEEYPVVASKNFEPLSFRRKDGEVINPVVLGVAIKGQMKNENGSRGGERLTKERALKEIRKKISDEFIGIFPKSYRGAMVGIKIKKNGGNHLGSSSTDSWFTDLKATYTYS